MDYTFRDEEEAASRRTWIGATAFALAVVIGIILVLRATSRDKNRPDSGGKQPQTTTQTAVPAADTATVGPAASAKPEKPAKPAEKVAPPPPPPSPPQRGASSPGEPERAAATPPAPEKRAGKDKAKGDAKVPGASAAVRDLIAQGQDAERRDDLAAARAAYEKALASPDIGDAKALAESRLGAVMVALATSPREMPEKIEHAIVSGDRIVKLAIKHGTTVELITKSNNLSNPGNIRLGDRLRFLDNPKFEILVSKSENWLLLKMNGKFFKRYTVGTGKFNRTPIGTFTITDKEEEPAWWKDGKRIPFGDPENILGTRWMKIEATGTTPPANGYGIHGTWDNSSLGQQSSAGCIRMANEDVQELYMLVPKGTPVTIEN